MYRIPSAFPRRGLLLVALASAMAWLFAQTVFYQRLNGWSEDALHRSLGPVLDMGDVVVVDIDEESIEQLKRDHGSWPYSRDLYARVVSHLARLGARSFAIDILLSEEREGDDELAAALGSNAVVAAAAFPRPPMRTEGYLRQLAQVSLGRAHNAADVSVSVRTPARPPALTWPDVTLPLAAFTAPGRARVGLITVRPDEDGTLRRLPLFHEAHGHRFPGFSLAVWATPEDLAAMQVREGRVRVRDRWFSVSDDGEVRLRFPREVRQLRVVAFHQLVRAPASSATPAAINWRDKTVFIGSSGILFGDFAYTPMGRMSGLVLSAVATRSLAAGHVLQPLAWPWRLVLVTLGMVPSLLWLYRQEASSPTGFAWALIATLLLVVPVGLLLFHAGYSAPWLLALAGGIAALGIAAVYGMLRLRSERERLTYERLAAQEASRMKGEFLAHMAHELRTPLTAIIGFNKINQLNDQIGAAQRRRNSELINRNGEHLLKLINDNLDLAKIEAGQMRLTPASHAPEQLVSEAVSTFGPLMAEKGLVLEERYERPLPAYLWLDALRVRQVLLNILGNAVKFTERGRVDVLVRWRDDTLDITVADTGPGIGAALAERLFEPFAQGESSAQPRAQGTGLGLSIARRLARLMGGDVSLESWPGQGSRFRVRIHAPMAVAPQPAASVPGVEFAGSLAGHILLVEDDEDIRDLMQRELIALGLSCRAVTDGLRALQACDIERFDLILMDLEMHAMSGVECVQVLRAHGVDVPVIAITAHARGVETEMALAQGFDAVLFKPVSTDSLALRLSAHLAPRRAPEAEARP